MMNKSAAASLFVLIAGLFYFLGQQFGSGQIVPPQAVSVKPDQELAEKIADLSRDIRLLKESHTAIIQQVEAFNFQAGAEKFPHEVLVGVISHMEELEERVNSQSVRQEMVSRPVQENDSFFSTQYEQPHKAERSAIRDAYINDDSAEASDRVDRENVEAVFESDSLSGLDFAAMDCRSKYCRLQYNDRSPDKAEASLSENELLLRLADHYGDDITVHGGERDGNSKSFYIEYPNG